MALPIFLSSLPLVLLSANNFFHNLPKPLILTRRVKINNRKEKARHGGVPNLLLSGRIHSATHSPATDLSINLQAPTCLDCRPKKPKDLQRSFTAMIRMGRGSRSEQTDDNTYQPQTPDPTPTYQYSTETATASRPVTDSESMARDIKEGRLSGF